VRGLDWKGLLIAIVAAAIGLWFVQPGASFTVEGRVAALAARMQGIMPQPMADGSTLRSVTAAGRTIVLHIDGRAPLEPEASDAAIATELCTGADLRDLIGQGGQVRIEAQTAKGEQIPAITVDRCDSV
jgi:hypothetical protein